MMHICWHSIIFKSSQIVSTEWLFFKPWLISFVTIVKFKCYKRFVILWTTYGTFCSDVFNDVCNKNISKDTHTLFFFLHAHEHTNTHRDTLTRMHTYLYTLTHLHTHTLTHTHTHKIWTTPYAFDWQIKVAIEKKQIQFTKKFKSDRKPIIYRTVV